jgi:hypothetical protein
MLMFMSDHLDKLFLYILLIHKGKWAYYVYLLHIEPILFDLNFKRKLSHQSVF